MFHLIGITFAIAFGIFLASAMLNNERTVSRFLVLAFKASAITVLVIISGIIWFIYMILSHQH